VGQTARFSPGLTPWAKLYRRSAAGSRVLNYDANFWDTTQIARGRSG
jgi:hypothetical protein